MFIQKRNIYVNMQAEAEVMSVGKAGLVVLIYNKIISHLKAAINAIETNNLPERQVRIQKALDLIELGLVAYLDLSKGDVAKNLQNFYNSTLVNITRANIANNTEDLQKIADSFNDLKEAWEELSKEKAAA